MSDVLSQDEVDALLKGITGGDIEVESDEGLDVAGVRNFDFANQDRIIRGRMPTLEMVHDRFARVFRASVSTALRRVVDISVLGTEMTKFGDFMRSVPLPTSLHLFKMEPLRGHALMVLEGKLVFAFVDTFFGGCGMGHVKLEGRDFTVIEQRLIRKVVDIALIDYEGAWEAVQPIEIQHARSEMNPQFVNIVPPSDVVVAISLEIELEEATGRLTICLPYSLLEPIKDLLRAGFQSETVDFDRTWLQRLRSQIREVRVNMMAELGTTEITGRDLLNMKIGDVLMLDQYSTSPIDVFVEDVLKVQGRVGVHRGNRAIQVESLVDSMR